MVVIEKNKLNYYNLLKKNYYPSSLDQPKRYQWCRKTILLIFDDVFYLVKIF